MKLSIIIPSYNMESKINKCLDSILNQNADKAEYEIIVVDSSIDDSEKLLAEYAKKFENVKIPDGVHPLYLVFTGSGNHQLKCIELE